MLHINDITLRVGGRILLEGATAVVPRGHKVALVGRNGSGKTTLFKAIAGDFSIETGTINLPPRTRIGYLKQDAPEGNISLLDVVLAADTERASLLEEAETAQDPHRIAEIHTRLADIEAHSAPARAAAILAGLGFHAEMQQVPCASLSGGMRMRVALAALLFSQPDLLLLDEPTNHLDLEAALWLEGFLKTYPNTILLISHDRDFLNSIPDMTIHLEGEKLVSYKGNYDQFERQRRERFERMSAMQGRQMDERRRIQAFIDRFRYKASKARQAQSRIKMLEKMEPIATVVEQHTISFDFLKPTPFSPPLIALEKASVGYGEKTILSGLDLRIDPDDRIALLGANGNGKSTFIKMLAGKLGLQSGSLRRPSKMKIGYFAQHQTEELTPSLSAFQQIRKLDPMVTEEKIRAYLGRFGFAQNAAETPIEKLSGGEKARLLFALMGREAPQVLLLDEPTNHLDVDSREALIQAINAYEGAVILVSHDAHLIEMCADTLWIVENGTCHPFEGDMEDYRRLLMLQRREERAALREGREAGKGEGNAEGQNRREQRKLSAGARAALAPFRKAARQAEEQVVALSRAKEKIAGKLADPALYERATPEEIAAIQKEAADLDRKITEAEDLWMAAEERLQAATQTS
ncbi:MAG TPA: glycosyl transferase family 1 [Rhodospirillaceae bacterium]|nr:MAG: glycosyl transferase family 1 [Alphaproteobacteria bacterium GWF2_58_20]HAU28754.1 glycosyl transferase family 1 [Rhodospirillaceae bacterium]